MFKVGFDYETCQKCQYCGKDGLSLSYISYDKMRDRMLQHCYDCMDSKLAFLECDYYLKWCRRNKKEPVLKTFKEIIMGTYKH